MTRYLVIKFQLRSYEVVMAIKRLKIGDFPLKYVIVTVTATLIYTFRVLNRSHNICAFISKSWIVYSIHLNLSKWQNDAFSHVKEHPIFVLWFYASRNNH